MEYKYDLWWITNLKLIAFYHAVALLLVIRYSTRNRQCHIISNLILQSTTIVQEGSKYSIATTILAINLVTSQTAQKIYAVIDPETGASLEYRNLMKGATKDIWATSLVNELGRLANNVGTRMPTGTNTLDFIPKIKVPKHKIPTYGWLVCDIKPNKVERHRTCLTLGGNLIDYPGDKSTAIADLVTIKYHLNSVIFDLSAKFWTTDIYLFIWAHH